MATLLVRSARDRPPIGPEARTDCDRGAASRRPSPRRLLRRAMVEGAGRKVASARWHRAVLGRPPVHERRLPLLRSALSGAGLGGAMRPECRGPYVLNAPDGPRCSCGRPSRDERGWCGTPVAPRRPRSPMATILAVGALFGGDLETAAFLTGARPPEPPRRPREPEPPAPLEFVRVPPERVDWAVASQPRDDRSRRALFAPPDVPTAELVGAMSMMASYQRAPRPSAPAADCATCGAPLPSDRPPGSKRCKACRKARRARRGR